MEFRAKPKRWDLRDHSALRVGIDEKRIYEMKMKWKKLMTNHALEQDCATGIANFKFRSPDVMEDRFSQGAV